MKKISLLLTSFCIFILNLPSTAQITYEATYNTSPLFQVCFKTAGWKYWTPDYINHEITFYNLNHSLYKIITIPSSVGSDYSCYLFSEALFDTDTADIEYMVMYRVGIFPNAIPYIRIFEESGNQIFSRDSIAVTLFDFFLTAHYGSMPILATDSGTFMILTSDGSTIPLRSEIYRLPGTLDLFPCCDSGSGFTGTNPNLAGYNSNFNVFTAPNPAKNFTKVYYQLPQGITRGELIFFNMNGVEVKRFEVDDLFNYVQVSTDDLPSGTYSYKIITSQGASQGKQLVVIQ